jgi:diguanylate cyclase (GGDEF)-like protein
MLALRPAAAEHETPSAAPVPASEPGQAEAIETPRRLFILALASIFLSEVVAMLALLGLPTMSHAQTVLLDASLVTLLLAPMLYVFFYRPFKVYLAQRAAMEQRLRELSMTDELTGVYNRRGLLTMAEHQLKVARRQNRGMLVLAADLDDLKAVNDRYGHPEGDQLLVAAALLLKNTFRDSDIVSRIGGDEFVVLQLANSDDAPGLTDRLQRQIQAYNQETRRELPLSVSVGTVYYPPGTDRSVPEMLARVDQLMYQQKHLRRAV